MPKKPPNWQQFGKKRERIKAAEKFVTQFYLNLAYVDER